MRSKPLRAPRLSRVLLALAVAAAGLTAVTWTQIGSANAASGSSLVGVGSNRCLDVTGNRSTAGTAVEIWDCNGGANQTWVFTSAGELRTFNQTMCLDASGGGTAPGTALVIWTCSGTANQKFRQNSNGSITGTQSGLCLDVYNQGTANGTAVNLWNCNGQGNQSWRTGSPSPGSSHAITRGALNNPNATAETRSLMKYLSDQYGNHILSGQYGVNEVNWLQSNVGRRPAVQGFDLIDYSPSRVARGATSRAVEDAIAWHNQGGIVTFCWHWNAPNKLIDTPGHEWYFGFYTHGTTFDVNYALNNTGSQDYKDMIRDIDAIVTQLKRLQSAKVPIIWRPLHEAEGGWFWWGAKGSGPAKRLYALLYDRLTNYHKLNNLIWDWNSIDPAWYPAGNTVDMVSADLYPSAGDHSTQASAYNRLVSLVGDHKIVALSENGALPDPSQLQNNHVDWSWFATWNGEYLTGGAHNSKSFLQQVYASPYVVTLDELPNLNTYQ